MADEKIEVLNQDGTTSYVDAILDMQDASRERKPMSKRVAIEFAEAPEFQRELTEAEAQKYGIKLLEVVTPELDEIKKQMTESYQKLGLSEAEAKLAADLDLQRRLY